MDYERFISALIQCVEEELGGDAVVERQSVLKNNDVCAEGLVLKGEKEKIAPILYMENFYQSFQQGESIEKIAESIVKLFRNCPAFPEWDFEELLDFASVRKQIIYKLVSAEKNAELLKKVPHLPVLDLAIIFFIYISEGALKNCSVLIKNDHMNLWKIPISVLYESAKKNTPRLCPCVMYPMSELFDAKGFEECEVYVLTNEQGVNGAAALLYPKMPAYIYRELQGSYYLIPSSVHEFLVVPERMGVSVSELQAMVREINETEVDAQDVLSDRIYYFDGDNIT